MKRYFTSMIFAKVFVIMAFAFCVPTAVTAQEYNNTPVEISRDKVRVNGEICYSHIVLEKQTLYSISKAYNVTIDDIYKYNPAVKETGLKKHAILIIPIVKVQPEEKAKTQPVAIEAKPQEEEVKIQPEKEVKVAVEKSEAKQVTPEVKAPKTKRKIHTVKWFESIEDIGYRYGVHPNAILRANNLTSKKLTKRQRLIIPNPGEFSSEEIEEEIIAEATEQTEQTAPVDTIAVSDSLPSEERKGLFPNLYFPKNEVNISLLLPFKANGTTANRQNMDFYSGVLLAIYDMSNKGISTNLNVFDVDEGNVIHTEDIMDSDVVIGPVSMGDITRTFSAEPKLKALVSPLDPRSERLVHNNNALIHAPTPHQAQYDDLISWIKEEMQPGDTVLFVTEKGTVPSEAVVNMTEAMNNSGLIYNKLSYSILEGRDIPETLAGIMSKLNTTRVFIASESEAFVNDVVRNLNVMIHQKYNVALYAPSKIRSFDTIEVENFHNTKMRVSTGYYIDYEDPAVREFLLHYRALFNTEPTQFAYQGYDLAKYFISICSKYGNRWMEKLEEESASMLQSNFKFNKTLTGGYINNSVHRIVYGDNWKISKVR